MSPRAPDGTGEAVCGALAALGFTAVTCRPTGLNDGSSIVMAALEGPPVHVCAADACGTAEDAAAEVIPEKPCCRCGRVLPATLLYFVRRGSRVGGRCRNCETARAAARYRDDPSYRERQLASTARQHERRKAERAGPPSV